MSNGSEGSYKENEVPTCGFLEKKSPGAPRLQIATPSSIAHHLDFLYTTALITCSGILSTAPFKNAYDALFSGLL